MLFIFLNDTGATAYSVICNQTAPLGAVWARGFRTLFILNSAEHETFLAHKCYNAISC